MPIPYTHTSEHPSKNKCFGVYGISEREKQFDDISKMGKHEICIPKPRILVKGILSRYRGEKN